MKIHTLPLSPPPPALPARVPSQTTTITPLPFQQQAAIDAVQPAPVRRSSSEARGSSQTQTKTTAGTVATPLLDANDPAGQQPYRRGALVDISA